VSRSTTSIEDRSDDASMDDWTTQSGDVGEVGVGVRRSDVDDARRRARTTDGRPSDDPIVRSSPSGWTRVGIRSVGGYFLNHDSSICEDATRLTRARAVRVSRAAGREEGFLRLVARKVVP